MKKILSIALIALLVAGTAFADFTGSATVGLGYNTESKEYGFSNDTATKVTFEATTVEAGQDAEGSVYAGIKGSFTLKIKDYSANEEGEPTWNIDPSIDEAYIKGENWEVSILGAAEASDFAKSAIDKTSYKQALVPTSVFVGRDIAAPGVTVKFMDWTVSGGFSTVKKEDSAARYCYIFAEPEDVVPDVKICTEKEFDAYTEDMDDVVVISKTLVKDAESSLSDALDYSFTVATPDFAFGDFTVAFGAALADASKDRANLGFSAKAGYANDTLSASVASDFVIGNIGADEVDFDVDIAANFAIDPVTIDAYYATKASTQAIIETSGKKGNKTVENVLSAKVAADLSSFDVPVSLAVYGKDIINSQIFGVSAKATIDTLTLNASFDFGVKAEEYLIGASASYAFESFTVAGGVNYKKSTNDQFYMNASIETSALIPGATLKLAYGPTTDTKGNVTSNLLKEKYGKVDATCKITF